MHEVHALMSAAAVTLVGVVLLLTLVIPLILGVADRQKISRKESRINVTHPSAAIPRSSRRGRRVG